MKFGADDVRFVASCSGRSTYHPSISMCCFVVSHAGPAGCLSIVTFAWRAWSPNTVLRSPVSTIVVVIVMTPGVCGGAVGAAAGIDGPADAPSATTMYAFAPRMIWTVRFRSGCLRTITSPNSNRSRWPLRRVTLSVFWPAVLYTVFIRRSCATGIGGGAGSAGGAAGRAAASRLVPGASPLGPPAAVVQRASGLGLPGAASAPADRTCRAQSRVRQ